MSANKIPNKNIEWQLMKCLSILLSFCFVHGDLLGDAGSDQTTPEKRKAMAEVFAQVKSKVIIVQGDDSSGSGFVVEMEEGKKFFVTNKHVVEGQKRVAAFLLNGKELQLGAFEVAKNRDLVRFAVAENVEALAINKEEPNIGEEIFIFGNSDGTGVATDLTGEIIGVGPENIEVSAKFVHGNSGSAVLNKNGEVVGVATFAVLIADPKDWTKRGSRFDDVRRFAVRFIGVEWESKKYLDFYDECVAATKKQQEENGIAPQVTAKFNNPRLNCKKLGNIGWEVCSNIELSLGGGEKTIKNPIIRVSVLIKGVDGMYYMRDRILDKAEGRSGFRFDLVPIYSYGNTSTSTFPTGNGMSVYYLEGLSYYQGMFQGTSRRGIKYFDSKRSRHTFELFALDETITGAKTPDIVCFRFECWQNGALAGVYNSKGPAQVNAKGIPVDWFVPYKYPEKFNYRNKPRIL